MKPKKKLPPKVKSAKKPARRKSAPKKMGRPTDYCPKMVEKIVALAQTGMIESEICRKVGICQSTMTNWKISHPDFLVALRAAKDVVDDAVEAALLKRAQGYEHKAVKIHFDSDGKVHTKEYIERYPPDSTSMIFWLKNRRRQQWRDVNKFEHSGEINTNVPQIIVTLPANGREAREENKDV